MENSARFQLNSPHVADEEIEGELIIINLVNGNYYNLLQEAAEIWQLLRDGMSLGETTDMIKSRYEGDAENICSGIVQFVGELEREGLVIPAREMQDATASKLPEANPAPPSYGTPTAERPVFTPPKLNVYIDMQKMILLDPIHEVDETGWPSVKPTTK